MKQTAVAPSNIAFIKYWGKKDEHLRLPCNGSISMNLSNLQTRTTVEFNPKLKEDDIVIDGVREQNGRTSRHLDRVRNMAAFKTRAKVMSVNSFPSSTGLSSSASGFAALTVAAAGAAGLKLTERELSILARSGSGSACRSIPDGFVEWLDGDTDDESYAVSIAGPSYWEIADIVAVVSSEKKDISTTEGQTRAGTSPFFEARLAHMQDKIRLCKEVIENKQFPEFGRLLEAEALEMHAVMLTSVPPLMYWLPTTVKLMRQVQQWRRDGLSAYFTINTGQDIHIICQQKDAGSVAEKLKGIPEVKKIIQNIPAKGACPVSDHLF